MYRDGADRDGAAETGPYLQNANSAECKDYGFWRYGSASPLMPTDLRNLALVLVSLMRYLEGTWAMDLLREKRLRRALDELAHLHALPSLGQLPPASLTVRVYVAENDPIEFLRIAVRVRVP